MSTPPLDRRAEGEIDVDDYPTRFATSFEDAADFCRADEVLRRRADRSGQLYQRVPIAELFPGYDPNEHFTGFYLDPIEPVNPDGTKRTRSVDFTGGTINAYYELGRDGDLKLYTMWPDPDRRRNPGSSVSDDIEPRLGAFIGVVLAPEVVVRIRAARRWIKCQPPEDRGRLRGALLDLIEHRRLTLDEWSLINDLEFADVDTLYGYLGGRVRLLLRGLVGTRRVPPWW